MIGNLQNMAATEWACAARQDQLFRQVICWVENKKGNR
jgi:hypothetical protein